MFSKILAFGLGALALVNAAPAVFSFQTPMLSCSVNMLGTSQAAVKSFDYFGGPGKYKIYNKAFPGLQLVALNWGQPVMLSSPSEDPSLLGVWEFKRFTDGSDGYSIINAALRGPLSPSGDRIIVGARIGVSFPFRVKSAGGEEESEDYVIELGDKVWSLGSSSEVPLHLEPQQGAARQLWRFERTSGYALLRPSARVGAGKYRISNKAHPGLHLVAREYTRPVTLSPLDRGLFGVWAIGGDGSAGYAIFNVGLGDTAGSSSDLIVVGGSTVDRFLIESAGGEDYIKLPDEDKAWTLGSRAKPIHLDPREKGAAKQLWRFEPVD
ncbi:hypothetical protein K438DRAFT_1984883 [Mycena galopus ATCC 62051]|nr:hypothetical protein K438DRAFT_1984883 [Mycena galopus ATCC 62051]